MKWHLILFILVSVTFDLVAAEVPPPAPSSSQERYLFIVDTSSSMQPLARESRQALFDLVYWGADGHMQPGDTYGIWSVDEELHAGDFPMQTWRAEQQLDLATKASVFLKEKTYRKQANYGKLSISLLSVVMNVKDVNLFLITDAEDPLVGLPLDEQIRQACAARAKQRAAQNKPFIIFMNARGGEIRSATVAIAGETINLPPRNSKPALARSRSATPTVVKNKKPAGRTVTLGYVEPETAGSLQTPPAAAIAAAPSPAPAPESPTPRKIPASPAPSANSETSAVLKSELAVTSSIAPGEAAAVVNAELREAVAPTQRQTELRPAAPGPIAEKPAAPPTISKSLLPVAARENQPGTLAVSVPTHAEPVLTARELFIVSGALMLVTIGLIIAFLKRLPTSSRGSSISKSIEGRVR